MVCFVLIVAATWYLSTAHHDATAEYAHQIVGVKPGLKQVVKSGAEAARAESEVGGEVDE